MPHEFKVKCYRDVVWNSKAKRGDVVFLKSRPDSPMSVCVVPRTNHAANTMDQVKTQWMRPDGAMETGEFFAEQLSL